MVCFISVNLITIMKIQQVQKCKVTKVFKMSEVKRFYDLITFGTNIVRIAFLIE